VLAEIWDRELRRVGRLSHAMAPKFSLASSSV